MEVRPIWLDYCATTVQGLSLTILVGGSVDKKI